MSKLVEEIAQEAKLSPAQKAQFEKIVKLQEAVDPSTHGFVNGEPTPEYDAYCEAQGRAKGKVAWAIGTYIQRKNQA